MQENLVFYKVNERIPYQTGLTRPASVANIIKEYELDQYEAFYQGKTFNEGSAIIHIYTNKLHAGCDYVGVGQYDMTISDETISHLETCIQHGIDIMGTQELYSQLNPRLLNEEYLRIFPYYGFPMRFVVDHFCRFFQISRGTFEAEIEKKYRQGRCMVLCNTFVVRKSLFDELAAWLLDFSKTLYDHTMSEPSHNKHAGHMGGLIERCVALFFLYRVPENQPIEAIHVNHIQGGASHRCNFGQY